MADSTAADLPRPQKPCPQCLTMSEALGAFLGHDFIGHRATSALLRAGLDAQRLAEISDRELLTVNDLGALGFARVRTVFPASRRSIGEQAAPAPFQAREGSAFHYSPVELLERIPQDAEVTRRMLTERATAAALWILTALSPADPRLWKHVDAAGIDFPAIIGEPGWGPAETGLIDAARHLAGFSDTGIHLSALADSLDDDPWDALLEALRIRRGRRTTELSARSPEPSHD